VFHQVNIGLHVFAGTIALILGALSIAFNRRPKVHRKLGKWFLYFLSVVVATGFLGWVLFRSDPFLLMLTVLSGYEGFAGYRIITMKEKPPASLDVSLAIVALLIGVVYVSQLSATKAAMSPVVVRSTLVALMIVTIYDILKYFFIIWRRIARLRSSPELPYRDVKC